MLSHTTETQYVDIILSYKITEIRKVEQGCIYSHNHISDLSISGKQQEI